eukprot:7018947-Prymnesium_polylepis.1
MFHDVTPTWQAAPEKGRMTPAARRLGTHVADASGGGGVAARAAYGSSKRKRRTVLQIIDQKGASELLYMDVIMAAESNPRLHP